MIVYILRGPSGAGKSTHARRIVEWSMAAGMKALVMSSDDFFKRDGEYKFDAPRLSDAHADCLRRYTQSIASPGDVDVLVVDNTNTSVAELAPYAALAVAFGHTLQIVTLDVAPAVASARGIHGVPAGTVERQSMTLRAQTQSIPRYWPHKTLENA